MTIEIELSRIEVTVSSVKVAIVSSNWDAINDFITQTALAKQPRWNGGKR
ncbi:MAG: hypothetical protein ACREJC_11500 [Tepidisphaeraceae bacterium]